jgi:hypothetical protein
MTRYALKLELERLAVDYPDIAETLRAANRLIQASELYDSADSEVRQMWNYADYLKERLDDAENFITVHIGKRRGHDSPARCYDAANGVAAAPVETSAPRTTHAPDTTSVNST